MIIICIWLYIIYIALYISYQFCWPWSRFRVTAALAHEIIFLLSIFLFALVQTLCECYPEIDRAVSWVEKSWTSDSFLFVCLEEYKLNLIIICPGYGLITSLSSTSHEQRLTHSRQHKMTHSSPVDILFLPV